MFEDFDDNYEERMKRSIITLTILVVLAGILFIGGLLWIDLELNRMAARAMEARQESRLEVSLPDNTNINEDWDIQAAGGYRLVQPVVPSYNSIYKEPASNTKPLIVEAQ